jgi:hypothetical protein
MSIAAVYCPVQVFGKYDVSAMFAGVSTKGATVGVPTVA